MSKNELTMKHSCKLLTDSSIDEQKNVFIDMLKLGIKNAVAIFIRSMGKINGDICQ